MVRQLYTCVCIDRMESSLYKCCFCLQTVVKPLVMCHQTHVGCFECVCEHMRHSENSHVCAICRDQVHLRFDRLILESASTFRRSKRRKTSHKSYEVFQKVLDMKKKSKFRPFTKTFRRFAHVTRDEDALDQLSEDIENINKAKESIKRLESQRLFERSRTSISI